MMAGSDDRWVRYDRWNSAIAEVVYPPSMGGVPVYLDLEEDVLEEIRDLAEPGGAEPEAALVSTVKETFDFGHGPARLWRAHLDRLDDWWQDSQTLEPPPILGLIAVLSLAAENMHEGEGRAANNYYDRLGELLGIKEPMLNCVRRAYRRIDTRAQMVVSDYLWTSLNAWLEHLEGNRGLPTAIAAGYSHIGFPLSQALVRRADRDKFAEMFVVSGLAPRSSLPSTEMEQVIDEWMSVTPCPASNNLERMWSKGSTARGRIVDVARLCLEVWDGSATDGDSDHESPKRQLDLVRVRAQIRRFPTPQLEVTMILPARLEHGAESIEVLSEDDTVLGQLDLVGAASGWLTPADPAEIEAGTLLGGVVSLRRADRPTPLRRRPRRLIPLRHDDLHQAYVEAERVQLGEDFLLLSRIEMAPFVAKILEVAARPGFTHSEEFPGLPGGWTLFEDVQILSSIPDSELRGKLIDLNVLQPLAVSQTALQDGMRLPGNIRKWSTARPPELRVSTESASRIRAVLEVTKPLVVPTPDSRSYQTEDPVLLWDLAGEELPDGDYQIAVFEDGAERPCATETLRLRSADNPALVLDDCSGPLRHIPGSPLFGISADVGGTDPEEFRCVPTTGDRLAKASPAGGAPKWYRERRGADSSPPFVEVISFPEPGENSCTSTGAHHMYLEMGRPGMSAVEGICKHCGLVKRYPTRARRKRSRGQSADQDVAPHINVHDLAPVRQTTGVDWQLGFDAVCHVGRGPISALERIALQIEPSSLFSAVFARRLQTLGHLEIRRHAESLLPRSWQVNDPTLVGLPGGGILVTGFRSDNLIAALKDFVSGASADLQIDDRVGCPPVIRVAGLAPSAIDDLLTIIREATCRPAAWAPRASECLAIRLPPLSRLIDALPETSAIGARSYQRWNPEIARFERAPDASFAGAFRLTGFTRAYIYRSADQLGSMTATLGDARLVKYAAALESGRPLVGYDAKAEVLYVPLGADLPGLYGRAAVLSSGYPPVENRDEGILQYRDVPPVIAAQIMTQLSS